MKNKFAVGDRLELIKAGGNIELTLERMFGDDGRPVEIAPGSGHQVWLALPEHSVGAFVARFL